MVEREKIAADLLDSPCDSVAMQRAQNIERFEYHQRQGALKNFDSVLHSSIGFQHEA